MKQKVDNSEKWLDLAKTGIVETAGVAKVALSNPIVGMVTAVALIEYLQGVKVYKGHDEWIFPPDFPWRPAYWGQVKEPLISQNLATTLETSTILLESVKGLGLQNLTSLLGLLKAG